MELDRLPEPEQCREREPHQHRDDTAQVAQEQIKLPEHGQHQEKDEAALEHIPQVTIDHDQETDQTQANEQRQHEQQDAILMVEEQDSIDGTRACTASGEQDMDGVGLTLHGGGGCQA